jgi:Predicted membrane protein
MENDVLHKSFEIGIFVKGIDAILEIIGGILLTFLNKARLSKIIILLTQHELSEDPKDVIANLMLRLSSGFSISSQHFGIFYLISHGAVKFILVILLWQKKVWSYSLSIVSLILFASYQLYRYTITHSLWLIALTIFDIIMIILTWTEYKRVKKVQ